MLLTRAVLAFEAEDVETDMTDSSQNSGEPDRSHQRQDHELLQ